MAVFASNATSARLQGPWTVGGLKFDINNFNFLFNNTNTITFNGDITGTNEAAAVFTSNSGTAGTGDRAIGLSPNTGVAVDYSGAIKNNGSAVVGLTKFGAGTLTLSGTAGSNYTGQTIVQSGQLIAGADALVSTNGIFGNSAGAIVVGSGTTLAAGAPSLLTSGSFTIARDISVGSLANVNAYKATLGGSNTSGTSQFTGNIVLNTTAANYTFGLEAATGGTVEFKTGTWTTNNKDITVGAAGKTGTVKISNNIGGSGNVTVAFGTFEVGASNTYTGNTTISGGTLKASVADALQSTGNITVTGTSSTLEVTTSNAVNDVAKITLDGGAIVRGSGVSETFGALTLTAESTINFGTGAIGTLTFGDYTPTFKLNIINFLAGNVLKFNAPESTVIENGSLFQFDNGFSKTWSGDTWTITAVPEPTTVAALALFLAFFGWGEVKRCRKLAKTRRK